ncbi:MAG: hypothetical protein RJA07_2163 [Bacteroidota bacterium]|jgi:predicted short-subunit dehydrogenase-like oxidoreductase (DUF2520 family)
MKKTITLIGSGNVATQLGLALLSNDFLIHQVVSKSLANAKKLANKLNCKAFNSFEKTTPSDIYLIAVNDDAIKIVAQQIHQLIKKNAAKKPLLMHTSGSVSVGVLRNNNCECGILYPLQTIKKNEPLDFMNVPIIYFSENKVALKSIQSIAQKLSNNSIKLNDEQRLALHIAAVFTNNFANHMVTIAQLICKKNKIDFKLLQPLLAETFEKLKTKKAAQVQTGPAKRNDKTTIKKHLQFLKSLPEQKVYIAVTNSIIQQ